MAEFPIVGIGSSAGGLEALQKLFGAVPVDSGLCFVVAAHLDPTQKSHMSELLARCTTMPVTQIESPIRIEPNHVYVIAPDRELSIKDGVVHSGKPQAPRGHRHPVDSFFRSLAEDRGERAVGIVLSGTGTNGSLGLRFIKSEGGVAIAQDPDSAAFQGMPRSAIGTGIVDLVLTPEKMPEALLRLVFLQMTGYSQSDLESRELTWRSMTPAEWVGVSLEQWDKLHATGRIGPYEKECLRKNGSRSWMLFAGASLDDGTVVEFSIDINDVSGQSRNESCSRRS